MIIFILLNLFILYVLYKSRFKIFNFIKNNTYLHEKIWDLLNLYTKFRYKIDEFLKFGKKGYHIHRYILINENNNFVLLSEYNKNCIVEFKNYDNNELHYIFGNNKIDKIKKNSNLIGSTIKFEFNELDNYSDDKSNVIEIDCINVVKNFTNLKLNILDFGILVLNLNKINYKLDNLKEIDLEILFNNFNLKNYKFIKNTQNDIINIDA